MNSIDSIERSGETSQRSKSRRASEASSNFSISKISARKHRKSIRNPPLRKFTTFKEYFGNIKKINNHIYIRKVE